MTPDISRSLGLLRSHLDEKIQSPSSPKGRAAYLKSLTAWSKAASKVAQSYADKLEDMRGIDEDERATKAELAGLLQTISADLARIVFLSGKLKK